MRNKKLIRGENYRVPRKLKKRFKKQGLTTIWLDYDTYLSLLLLQRASQEYDMSLQDTLTKIVMDYIKEMGIVK